MTDSVGIGALVEAWKRRLEEERELQNKTAAVIAQATRLTAETAPERRDRGLGAVQKRAITAAIAVFVEGSKFDFAGIGRHQMARAIVAKAKELGMPDMDPRSGSVKAIAEAAVEAARVLSQGC